MYNKLHILMKKPDPSAPQQPTVAMNHEIVNKERYKHSEGWERHRWPVINDMFWSAFWILLFVWNGFERNTRCRKLCNLKWILHRDVMAVGKSDKWFVFLCFPSCFRCKTGSDPCSNVSLPQKEFFSPSHKWTSSRKFHLFPKTCWKNWLLNLKRIYLMVLKKKKKKITWSYSSESPIPLGRQCQSFSEERNFINKRSLCISSYSGDSKILWNLNNIVGVLIPDHQTNGRAAGY